MTHYFIKQGKQKMKIDLPTFKSILSTMRKAGVSVQRRIGARYDSMLYYATVTGHKFTLTRRHYK